MGGKILLKTDNRDELIQQISELEAKNARLQSVHSENLKLFKSLEAINRIIIEAPNLNKMLDLLLQELLNIFSCDRAWLLYPCDPTAETYRVPMERTRPEWPGA